MGETTAEGDGDACSKALADCSASREVRLTAAELLPPFYRQAKGTCDPKSRRKPGAGPLPILKG